MSTSTDKKQVTPTAPKKKPTLPRRSPSLRKRSPSGAPNSPKRLPRSPPRSPRHHSRTNSRSRFFEEKRYEAKFAAEDFRKDVFNPEGFVSGLTEELFRDRKQKMASKHSFNPLPFQQIFNDAMLQLHQLREETDERIGGLLEDTRHAEDIHKRNLARYNQSLGTSFRSFRSLDQRISKVAHTAVRIGDHLEVVDKKKQQTQHGKEIIQHFLQFNDEDISHLDRLSQKKGSKRLTKLHEASDVIQELQRISEDLQVPATKKAIELIATKSNELENNLLDEFDDASNREDINKMQQCAKTLLNFDGSFVIKRYVYKATDKAPFTTRYSVQTIRDFETSLDVYFKEILITCQKECNVISKVFADDAPRVIKLLIERIFEEKIVQFVDSAQKVKGRTTGDHLTMLDILYKQTQDLVKNLKLAMAELHQRHSNSGVEVSLGDLMEALFARYREDYMKNETGSLKALINAQISASLHFAGISDEERKKSERGQKWMLKKSTASVEEQLRWLNKVLEEKDMMGQLLKATSTATTRCLAVSDPPSKADNVKDLCYVLLSLVCDNYIEPILTAGDSILPDVNPRTEPSYYYLNIVSFVNKLMQELNTQFRTDLLPKMNTSNMAQDDVRAHKEQLLSVIEENILDGLARVLSAAVNWCARILSSHQKKIDFRPKDDNFLFDTDVCSQACRLVTDFLTQFFDCACCHLEGKNLDCFVEILGTKFYGVLVDHVKKYTISSSGAPMLMRDLKVYEQCLQQVYCDSVNDKLDHFRHVVNIFAVKPEDIRALIADDPEISKIDIQDLRDFVKLRADYKSAKVEMFFG